MLVKGSDYARSQVVGRETVEAGGGKIILVDIMPGYSTSDIVARSRAVGRRSIVVRLRLKQPPGAAGRLGGGR